MTKLTIGYIRKNLEYSFVHCGWGRWKDGSFIMLFPDYWIACNIDRLRP